MTSDRCAADPGRAALRVVVDTNIWLDLYWFHDPGALALEAALRSGRAHAVRSAATDLELRAVLARPAFDPARRPARAGPREPHEHAVLLAHWAGLAQEVDASRPAPWVCRDPDDQKFLDLAVSAQAAILFTKDRDLLALARSAGRAGLRITPPKDVAW